MKYRLIFLFFIVFAISTGCCSKRGCGYGHRIEVDFEHCIPADVDTLYITGYKPGTNFSDTLIARFMDSAINYQGTPAATPADDGTYFHYFMDAHLDWELQVASTGEIYRFSNVHFKYETCDACLLGSAKGLAITGFVVNDSTISGMQYGIIPK